jgi:hypothetical protein
MLNEHPELEAMAITVGKRKDGNKHRRWPIAALDAWVQRQG